MTIFLTQLDDEFKRSIERQDEAKRTKVARRLFRSGVINRFLMSCRNITRD